MTETSDIYTVVDQPGEPGRFNVRAPEGYLCCARGEAKLFCERVARTSNKTLKAKHV